MRWFAFVLAGVLALVGCKDEVSGGAEGEAAAGASASATATAAASASARAKATTAPTRGGSVVRVGDHFVELLLYKRGNAEGWVLDDRGADVKKPESFKLSLRSKADAATEIDMAWSDADLEFTGDTADNAEIPSAALEVELEVGGTVATGILERPVLLVGPTFGGRMMVAGDFGAEVAVEPDGLLEVRLAAADGVAIDGGVELAANVEAEAGGMQRIELAFYGDLGRFRGRAEGEVELAAGPFVLFIDGKFAARLPKLGLRANAQHGGYVVMVGNYSVELVADGKLLTAYVFDASGAAVLDGGIELAIQIGGEGLVYFEWDADTAKFTVELDAQVDLDAKPIRLVAKAGGKVAVGGFAAGSVSAKAKVDPPSVDVDASADIDAKSQANATAKGNVGVPNVNVDGKTKTGKGKASAKGSFSIGN